jgi:hypothetical protein
MYLNIIKEIGILGNKKRIAFFQDAEFYKKKPLFFPKKFLHLRIGDI